MTLKIFEGEKGCCATSKKCDGFDMKVNLINA
jgi:hypothetical protein